MTADLPGVSHGEPSSGRVLALDVGSKRIGLAVSDPLGITAQGLETLQRKNKRTDFEHLKTIIEKYGVKEIDRKSVV